MGGDGVYFETEGKIGIASTTQMKRGKQKTMLQMKYKIWGNFGKGVVANQVPSH